MVFDCVSSWISSLLFSHWHFKGNENTYRGGNSVKVAVSPSEKGFTANGKNVPQGCAGK